MSVEAVLIRKSTKEIIKHGLYPRDPITPFLEGEIDPDYEWLIKYIPFTEPMYDPRIYIMVTNFPDLSDLSNIQQHPNYPGIREYRITYSPEKRSNADIVMSIENAEKEANDSVFAEAGHKDELVFMMASVLKASKGLALTSSEQAQVDKLTATNVKLAKNLDNRNALVALVNAGLEPNIDAGWEK